MKYLFHNCININRRERMKIRSPPNQFHTVKFIVFAPTLFRNETLQILIVIRLHNLHRFRVSGRHFHCYLSFRILYLVQVSGKKGNTKYQLQK